jgi:hypothetical protein
VIFSPGFFFLPAMGLMWPVDHHESKPVQSVPPVQDVPLVERYWWSDVEIERVSDEGCDAGINAMHMASAVNPYAESDSRAEIWSTAFRNAYARNNGY